MPLHFVSFWIAPPRTGPRMDVSRKPNYSAAEAPSPGVRFTIPLELAGARLDGALAKLMPGESRSRLARLIEEGHVLVDGAVARGRMKLKSGEAVEVTLAPRPSPHAPRPQPIALSIVHEDADVMVVDKP